MVDLILTKRQRDEIAIEAARQDPTVFLQLVARLEDGRPIKAVPKVHREWNEHFSKNRRAIVFAAVAHGKSMLLIYRVLWELGRNPNLRIALIGSAKGAMPVKTLSKIKDMIADENPDAPLHRIFPHLKPSVTSPLWKKEQITVERSEVMPDPTIQTFGLDGKIHGSRIDLTIFDDFCDGDNTRTENMRDKSWEWVTLSVLSRTPPKGGRVWLIGNVWHEDDVLHRLVTKAKFVPLYHSAWMPNPDNPDDEHDEVPSTPELWSKEALLEKELDYGGADAPAARMMLRNELLSDANRRIRLEWIQKCYVPGLKLQESWNPLQSVTYSGVDLSVGSKDGDESVIFTITVHPDGTRQILDIRRGKWLGPKIIEELVDVYKKYGSVIAVEGGNQQDYIMQFASAMNAVPLQKHITGGQNKHHIIYGVESIGTELAQKKWMIPINEDGSVPRVIEMWVNDLLRYSPDDHTPDALMATWICRECARLAGAGHGWIPDGSGGYHDPIMDISSWYS